MGYKEDYIDYIDTHVANVKAAYDWLLRHEIDSKVDFGDFTKLEYNIRNHDKSKWDDEEFEAYAKYFYLGKNNKAEFDRAWNHHQKVNPHHWQYWVLIKDNPDVPYVCIPMDNEYIVEMVCDWWSFSFKTGNLDEIFHWYEQNKPNQLMHKDTRATVEALLREIKRALKEDEKKESDESEW